MREILFRGKRTDNGQWAEGFLVKRPSAVQIGDCSPWYISVPPKDPEDNGGLWNVTAETVGQFTGLTDKIGKRIFEGDILKTHYANARRYDFVETVVFRNGRFCAEGNIGATGRSWAGLWDGVAHIPQDKTVYMDAMEVIGNIHDNPELLEVE